MPRDDRETTANAGTPEDKGKGLDDLPPATPSEDEADATRGGAQPPDGARILLNPPDGSTLL